MVNVKACLGEWDTLVEAQGRANHTSQLSPLLRSSAPQSEQEAPRLLGYEVKHLSLFLSFSMAFKATHILQEAEWG